MPVARAGAFIVTRVVDFKGLSALLIRVTLEEVLLAPYTYLYLLDVGVLGFLEYYLSV